MAITTDFLSLQQFTKTGTASRSLFGRKKEGKETDSRQRTDTQQAYFASGEWVQDGMDETPWNVRSEADLKQLYPG